MANVSAIAQHIPGPRELPLFGWRMGFVRVYHNPYTYLPWLHRKHGNVVSLAYGDPSHVVAFGPENNLRLLTHPNHFEATDGGIFQSLPQDSSLNRMQSHNVALVRDEKHRHLRHMMQSAFHRKMLTHYHNVIVASVKEMLMRWEKQETFDLNREMKQLAQQVVMRALFGFDDMQEFGRISSIIFKLTTNVLLATLLPVNIPGTPYRRVLQQTHELGEFFLQLIKQKRTQPDATDILAELIRIHDEDGGSLTDDELFGNAVTLYVASFETTTNALAWTLFLLHQHPQVLSDLIDELDGTLHGTTPTAEQIAQLPFLDCVLKESLRILPPVSVVMRKALIPCELDGYELPVGATIMYSPLVTHRLPDLYEEPNRFKPERWFTLKRSPYEYLPFGAGPRMCISAAFVTHEIKVVLSMLLQRYRIKFAPNISINTSIRARHGYTMPVRAIPQDRHFQKVPVRGDVLQLVDLTG